MTGTLISARMIPPVSRLVPCAAPVSALAKCRNTMVCPHQLPGISREDPFHDRAEHHQADKAPDNRGDRGQQFDNDLEGLLHFPLANSEHINRCSQSDGHSDQERNESGREGSD